MVAPASIPTVLTDSGRLTASAAAGQNVLNDTTKRWAADIHKDKVVRIQSPGGRIHTFQIAGNTASALVLTTNITEAISAGSSYEIAEFDLDTVLRTVFGNGANIDLPAEFQALKDALGAAMEATVDIGLATGGSQTTIVDTTRNWQADMWVDATAEVVIGGIHYLRLVTGNTADTITIDALPAGISCSAGCEYSLKRPLTLVDISDRAARLLGVIDSLTSWGGTPLTGRDISLDLANLDITLSALRDAICAAAPNAKTLDDLHAAIGAVGGTVNRSSFITGQKTVTAAGTAEQLPNQAVPDGFAVAITAKEANTGLVYVGNSKANAENHAVALPLSSGRTTALKVTNLNLIWIDAAVNAEGIDYILEA